MPTINFTPTANNAYLSPAKLNLMLKVVGKRADGYHLLETVFCLIDLCDTLYLQARDDGKIVLHNPQKDIPPENDLTVRAALALQRFSGCTKGVDIYIDKKIPMGGGLGGGSSNAATVLMVLNHLWACGLNRQTLIEIGTQLGADVPFFIFGQTAFATGIGEKLTPLPIDLPHFVIIHPNIAVSTQEIFSHFVLTSSNNPIKIDRLTESIPLINDLQNIAVMRYPKIAHALAVLQQYGDKALMTGSGSCVFLQVENGEKAQHIAAEIQTAHPEYSVWAAKGLPQHPLANLLA
ncbi:MAG: 4-(cytidine 5'-diphospho)-2-C-methyl-D-erythritol kinase [Neisseriaceae bacterium]|nr:4-(cytidine 5'-diphospho)-2-C-methyl-D-erythritol kinase [Neisseriaceae bacterium]